MAAPSTDQAVLMRPAAGPGSAARPAHAADPSVTAPDFRASEDRQWPRLGVQLLVLAFGTWLAGALYTLYANPEIRFFEQAARIKRDWAAKITAERGPKTVFFGGSSCTFAVDPETLLKEHGLPSANLGLGAGMGLRVLTRFALEQVADGDTLIMAMEPTVLTQPMEDTMLGVQISYALHHPQWLARGEAILASRPVPWISTGLMLRPGGYHVFTLLGKLVSHKPLYRYHAAEFSATGWQQTAVRLELSPWLGSGEELPGEVRTYLFSLRQWCEAHHVRIAYSLPWTYTDRDHAAALRQNNLKFLKQVAAVMPVLKDSRLGVDTVKEDFADTVWHLAGNASRSRTSELADQIKAWKIWSAEELAAVADGKEAL